MKSRFIFLMIWVMLLHPEGALAYFQVPSTSPPLSQTPLGTSDEGAGRVALLGNQISGSPPQVRPWSNRFSPLDMIPVDQPLSIVLKKPIRPEGNLADMLYANVKLKALMDQYEVLQRRSAELLEGLSVPGASDSGIKKSSGTSPPSPQLSVAAQKAELDQSHRAIVQEYEPRAITGAHLTGRESGPGQTQSLSAMVNRLSEADEASPKAAGGEVSAPLDAPPSGISATDPRPMAGHTPDTSLPWIFEVALKLIRYFFSHKIEAIVIGAVGLSVIMILSSLRRSR